MVCEQDRLCSTSGTCVIKSNDPAPSRVLTVAIIHKNSQLKLAHAIYSVVVEMLRPWKMPGDRRSMGVVRRVNIVQ